LNPLRCKLFTHDRWPEDEARCGTQFITEHRNQQWAEAAVKGTRIQVTLETHTVTIIRQSESVRGWCGECADEVEMLGIEGAGFLIGLAEPVVRDCPQVHGWHFSTSAAGMSLVCLNSLRDSIGWAIRTGDVEGKQAKQAF
jgi:hypothetical protein